jgi:hypothetical protein
MKKPNNLLGWVLSILASGAAGMAAYILWPMFTMWFIHTDLAGLISVCILFMVILFSAMIPSIPVEISNHFGTRKNYVLAGICSLFMGLPVTVRQIMDWNLNAQPQTQNGWRVEGGGGMTAFIFIVFPGIVFIVATFVQMLGKGGKVAAYPAKEEDSTLLNPVFVKKGRKYKIWSIINTVFLFIYVLPILAIVESSKAQRSQDKESYGRHVKKVIVLNLCSYVLFVLVPFLSQLIRQAIE